MRGSPDWRRRSGPDRLGSSPGSGVPILVPGVPILVPGDPIQVPGVPIPPTVAGIPSLTGTWGAAMTKI
jgi:hypothetical protein